jgi:hypothetical protein
VAERIISTIEAATLQNIAADADPTPPEAAVIAYAMGLRERLEAPPPDLLDVAEPANANGDAGGVELRVAVTSAFLTGRPLRVHISEYEAIQANLTRALGGLADPCWSTDADPHRGDGTYVSGGGFTNMLPLVIARRDGADLLDRAIALLQERPEPEQTWLARTTNGWSLTPSSITIDIYDLGMAVMNGTFTVRAPRHLGLDEIARTLKRIVWLRPDTRAGVRSPISEMFGALARETTDQFAAVTSAVAAHTVQPPWLAPFLDALPDGSTMQSGGTSDWGRLLWLHPVHHLEIDKMENLRSTANSLAPPFNRKVPIPDGCFVPGIGWSAIVTVPGANVAMPLELLQLHWAYLALYMEIDRGLLAVLDRDRPLRSDSLAQLEQDADHVFTDYIRVMEARARIDSALASLGGDEQAIWDVISDVTKFDALVNGVDRKVDVLQQITERRVQQASAAQARRTSGILSFLTALTVVTVTVALITNFLGSRSDTLGHIELRIVLIAVAVVASIGLYLEAYRERPRRIRR